MSEEEALAQEVLARNAPQEVSHRLASVVLALLDTVKRMTPVVEAAQERQALIAEVAAASVFKKELWDRFREVDVRLEAAITSYVDPEAVPVLMPAATRQILRAVCGHLKGASRTTTASVDLRVMSGTETDLLVAHLERLLA